MKKICSKVRCISIHQKVSMLYSLYYYYISYDDDYDNNDDQRPIDYILYMLLISVLP